MPLNKERKKEPIVLCSRRFLVAIEDVIDLSNLRKCISIETYVGTSKRLQTYSIKNDLWNKYQFFNIITFPKNLHNTVVNIPYTVKITNLNLSMSCKSIYALINPLTHINPHTHARVGHLSLVAKVIISISNYFFTLIIGSRQKQVLLHVGLLC